MVAARPYAEVVERLSAASVKKHFDAYTDVEWDEPQNAVRIDDPRFAFGEDAPIGMTDWYRNQPPAIQAQMGLHMTVHQMKVGVFFENILTRGLLEFAMTRPDGSPDFRYAYHEAIEESQHSLMFQEFVNRAGLHVPGVRGFERFMAGQVPRLGRVFPELFFFFVLGGETPIDFSQRETLESGRNLHPLLERIMRIHTIEEARHLCFAEKYIMTHAPMMSAARRLHLRLRLPFVLYFMSKQMLEMPSHLIKAYGVPASVVRESYAKNETHRRRMQAGIRPVADLARRTDILTPATLPLWERLGLLDGTEIAQA